MSLETSILKTVRQLIGPSVSYDIFDTDLIININAAFSRLCQLGVGPLEHPFMIHGEGETWSDFIADEGWQEEVKQYIFLKTKLIFDPPQNGTVINVYKEQIDMLEQTMKDTASIGY